MIDIVRNDPVAVESDDAALSALTAAPATLVPAFSPDVTNYTATVDDTVDAVQLVASPRHAGATQTLNGNPLAVGAPGTSLDLEIGNNLFTIQVTAEDGTTTRDYVIDIVRNDVPVEPIATTTVQLLVLDTSRAPVTGAQVTADDLPGSATTDDEGRAFVVAPAIDGAVLRLTRNGFVDQLVRLDLSAGSDPATPLLVAMVPRAAAQSFAANAPVTLTADDGARVELPANAFVDGAGNPVSGQIDAFITPLDIRDDDALAAFPGGYAARGPGEEPGSLITLGVADFSFSQGGQRLQLAPGVIATIDVPIYVTQDAQGNPLHPNDLIPLWELDETDAVWNYEGDALVVASAGSPTGWALRGEARHFSWWNADIFVGRTANSPGVAVFESQIMPRLYCDDIGTACDGSVPGDGAWVTAAILGLDGPRQSINRWVPFGADEVAPIPIPIFFDIGVTASVADGYYVVGDVTPTPVRSDLGDEVIVVNVLLQARHLVNDGYFVPGERLRGYMEEADEVHTYRFEGRAGRVFRLRAYPAADAASGPGISSDLGATVRVWRDDELLAEAPFDATQFAEIDVALPADDEYRVTFTADGKVPGFYVATTALLFNQPEEGGLVAFPAQSAATGIGLYRMNNEGDGFDLLTPAGISTTCLSPKATGVSCAGPNQQAGNGGRGDNFAPGPRDGFFRELAPGQIIYVSDHDRPGFADLFSLNLDEPGLATRLSGAEIAGVEGYSVLDFRHNAGSPRLVYKVTPVQLSLALGEAGALYVVEVDAPEQRRAIPLFDGPRATRFELSADGRWVVYESRTPDIGLIMGDLFAVDLDSPGALPVPVNPALNFIGGERMGSFAISPDSRWVTYSVLEIFGEGTRRQAYLVDLENPAVPIRVSAEANTRTMEARFAPDGSAIVYRNAGSANNLQGAGPLFIVDLSDPSQPGTPVSVAQQSVGSSSSWRFSPAGDQIVEVTNRFVYGYSLAEPGPAAQRVALLQVPIGQVLRGDPVYSADGQGILLQLETSADLPRGLIYQRFGDPVDGYRTLLESEDFPVQSRGVFQMALSPDGLSVIAAIGRDTAGSEQLILSVPLAGERIITQLVPERDEAQDLTLRMIDTTDRWYQFLPLGD